MQSLLDLPSQAVQHYTVSDVLTTRSQSTDSQAGCTALQEHFEYYVLLAPLLILW